MPFACNSADDAYIDEPDISQVLTDEKEITRH
jgi:hypothetical protein